METVSMIFQGGYAKIEETKVLDRRGSGRAFENKVNDRDGL